MKILIIDDEPLVRKSLGRACRARGHVVTEAEDGNVGLDLWLSEAPQVAFVDVLMPGLSGPELLAEVVRRRGSLKPTKVILISAYSGEHKLAPSAHASEDPFDLFIPKPFENVFDVVAQAEALYGDSSSGPLS